MVNDECPCKDCVAPKRFVGCHSKCEEYTEWNTTHQQELTDRRIAKQMERATDPTTLWKSRKRRIKR